MMLTAVGILAAVNI